MIEHNNINDGQTLWYCKLDLHEVTYVKNPYNDGRFLVKFPPNNIKSFTDAQNIFISRRNAINSILKRIETMEGTSVNEINASNDVQIDQLNNIMAFFDVDAKNLAFTQLISSIEERLTKLELNRKANHG